jgi:ferric-dicitrate binding protein FerR (iron transport regulator)
MRKILLFAAALAASPSLFAQSRIDFSSGQVTVGKNPAAQAQELHPGDVVATGPDAAAVLLLEDGTKVKLKSDSKVELVKLRKPAEVKLLAGGVFSQVDHARGAGFKMRTKTATMGVRGTQFFTSIAGDDGDVWMCVNDGEVAVTLDGTRLMPQLVKAGQGIQIAGGKKITPPRKYKWTEELNWKMDAKEGDIQDKTDLNAPYREKLLKHDYD